VGAPSQKAIPGLLQIILNGVPADDPLTLQAGLLTVAGGIISWAYQSANIRFGVADVFAAEIATLCRVAAVDDFMAKFVNLFKEERKFPDIDASRDYLAMYNSNAKDLESLDGDAARYVTQYYVHMKALMDQLQHGADPRENPRAALSVIYAAFLAFESARQALAVLMDNRRERQEYVLTAMLSEIYAYSLLLDKADDLDDPDMGKIRKNRIEARLADYESLIAAIKSPELEPPSREIALQIHQMWDSPDTLGVRNKHRIQVSARTFALPVLNALRSKVR
jgi:hypothetical protein